VSRKLIILIENDANLRQSLTLILQRAGYQVTATDDVCEALDLLQCIDCQLLISDINVPATSQVLLPMILKVHPHLAVLILSALSSTETEAACKQFGAHYLVKPVAPEHLIDSVRSIMGNNKIDNHIKNNTPSVDRH
jgi:DNA-binding response OmpR family regulator